MDFISELRTKYATNPNLLQKLETYLANLPIMLQAAEEEQVQREIRRTEAAKKRNAFTSYFLEANPFFYVPQTETYIQYADHAFSVVSEDDITHMILKHVNADRTLATWKYKIKIQILKKIKDTGLLDADPDPVTTRLVVRTLWPAVFATKCAAKYFLTVLGDLLRGKRGTTYFLDPSFKPFIHVLGDHVATTLNKHITDDFKFKYVAQPFSSCRTIPGKATDHQLKLNVLSIATVAAHYSRAASGDDFLNSCEDVGFAALVFGIKDQTPASLVSIFIREHTTQSKDHSLRFKDLFFLWRVFQRDRSLPNVVSPINLKHILTESGVMDAATEECRGLAPRQAPAILNFKHFWDTYVTPNESDVFEVAELAELYNAWCEGKHLHLSAPACGEWLAPKLVGSKARVSCSLWDKRSDIANALDAFEQAPDYSDDPEAKYAFYCTYTKRFSKMLVSREYFFS
jgi:hypothetical protein